MLSKKKSIYKRKDLTPEEREALKIKARRQFKAGFRLVLNNKSWYTAAENSKRHVHDSKSILTRSIKHLLTFNDKILLKKHSSLRTQEEKMYLYLVISNTKLFRLYPEEVRIAAAGSMYFNSYEAGRILTKEGGESTMICYIISGEIKLYVNCVDPILNTKTMKYVKSEVPGSTFGEMDILINTPRKFTRIISSPVQFLYITKEDLNAILDNSVRTVWNTIEAYISKMPYFAQYNREDIQEVIITSRVLEFQAEDVVLANGIGFYGYTHIIIEGLCRLVGTLMMVAERKASNTSYTLYPGNIMTEKPPNVEIHYMQICTMKYGCVFNVGEHLENRTVIAKTYVKCMCIPNYLLSKRNIWILLQEQLNKHIPSREQLFYEFKNQQKWLKYRKELQDDILVKHYIPSYNRIENLSPTYAIIPIHSDKNTFE